MRPLTRVSGSFSAHLLAARLHWEGIEVQLRGALNSPYGLTMGEMSRVDVFVPEDQLADAQLVMLATEVDQVLAPPRDWAGDEAATGRRRWALWVALGLLVLVSLAPLLRLLS